MSRILMIFALCMACVMCQGSKGYYSNSALSPNNYNNNPYPSPYSYYNQYQNQYPPSYNNYYPSYQNYPNYYPNYQPNYYPYSGSSYPGAANPSSSYPGTYNQVPYGANNGGYYRPGVSTSATPSSSYQYPRMY